MASSDSKLFSSSNIISIKQLQLCGDPIWTDCEFQFLRDNYNKLTYDEHRFEAKGECMIVLKGKIVELVEKDYEAKSDMNNW